MIVIVVVTHGDHCSVHSGDGNILTSTTTTISKYIVLGTSFILTRYDFSINSNSFIALLL